MRTAVTPIFDPDLPSDRPDDRPGCGEARTAERALPLMAIDIDARVHGLTASCHVRQRFTNPIDRPAEVTYVFPLPNRGAVTAMTATLGGRRVEGRLLERGQARQKYEDALAVGQRASLAEKDRPDVFTVTLGNLRPGEDAEVELDLVCPLEVDDGEATFRFPLVVAPRYTGGVPLDVDAAGSGVAADTDAVPDASRVTPPRLRPDDPRPDLRCRVEIDDAGFGLTGWRSSLHAVTADDGGFHFEPGERLDRDLILRATMARDHLVTSAVAVPDPDGPEGTWMVSLVAPDVDARRTGRDVVVVLDRSGSMSGWKLVAARRAAARLVDSLEATDRFVVLAFDNIVESPTVGLTDATDRNRFATVRWLANLEARGGTELGAALQAAAGAMAGIEGRARSLVLITDGQVSGEDAVLTAASDRLAGVTVHCVGIDQAVNAGLLDRLTGMSGGRLELVESEDRLDECLLRICRVVNPPVLTDVEVTLAGAELIADSITPPVRDAVTGIPFVIAGRYRAAGSPVPLRVVLRAGGPGCAALPAEVVAASDNAPAVPVLWARQLIGDLEDRYAGGERDPGLSDRIIGLSLRFGVLSRFTAFVAVDAERGQTDDMISITQPVEQPSGWPALANFRVAAAPAFAADWAGAGPSVDGVWAMAASPRVDGRAAAPPVGHDAAAPPLVGGHAAAPPPRLQPDSAPPRAGSVYAAASQPVAKARKTRGDTAGGSPRRPRSDEERMLAGVGQLLDRIAAGERIRAATVRRWRQRILALAPGSPRSSDLDRLASAVEDLSEAIANATGPSSEDGPVGLAMEVVRELLADLLSGADVRPAAGRRFWARP